MKLPSATYRLQFREGMDFARATALVPYLRDLGVSHLYASPVFTATPGSTHGYDVTDPNEIEPGLGGRDGLMALSDALRAAGLGLILDIVPNHMAFSPDTPWLRDVLLHGEESRYANHFDIDWEAGRLRLPWLTAPFEALLDDISVGDDGNLAVSGMHLPTRPTGDLDAARAGDHDALRRLHDAQAWRLTHWRTEAAAITHRRFFTVTGLIGLRVEDEAVFEDVHRLTFELVDAGVADGLRVDHVDGLADPAAYLDRLRARLPDTPVWIEKILTGDEALPDWPVQGTTGYVAARAIARVLTDGEGADLLADVEGQDFRAELAAAKDQIVTTELTAELDRLTDLALAEDPREEWGRGAWRDAILSYIRAFPRYRTYATEDVGAADAALIAETVAAATAELPDPGALPDLGRLLTDPDRPTLRLRLQQVTGAAIAKAQEDTSFYRFVPLLSANEVGGEPDEPDLTAGKFHRTMLRRAAHMPAGLTLTSSHDTKRSEDARMRIAAISHMPQARDVLMRDVPDLPDSWSWYLAQSAWAAAPGGDLAERLAAHLTKAMREAKLDTFWTDPDEAFEDRVTRAARKVAGTFDGVERELADLAQRAERLALAQCALKLTIPGIPDIYQGTEIGSFRLTDPDNRAAVPFDRIASGEGLTAFDRAKLSLTGALLHLRRDRPEIGAAPYERRDAPEGQLAFARGPLTVTVSIRGEALPPKPAFWPPEDLGPQAARIALD